MKKIVISEQHFADSQQGRLLKECLRTLFPECEIKIQKNASADNPDKKIQYNKAKNRSAM